MKKKLRNVLLTVAALLVGVLGSVPVQAEDNDAAKAATSISISPVSKILTLQASSVYEDTFKVTNNGAEPMDFETYASPYSYAFSETDNEYKLGFNRENTYTQITRWITFKDEDGDYVENPKFTAEPGESVEVAYRISTPSSIPAGGQYAVLFAHTLSSTSTASGIKTEASPGLVVYGRSEGETITAGEISDMTIGREKEVDGEKKTIINASAKVKNTGNVDFMAQGKLSVTGIFGRTYYETATTSGRISVIPDAELSVADAWDGTPFFGLFRVKWTVAAAGETEESETMILILPPVILIGMILLLTFIIIWIIIMVRKSKERRSRFMV